MAYLNDNGAKRLSHLGVSAGVQLLEMEPRRCIIRDGELVRKFKLYNFGMPHFVELTLEEYSHVHPADVQPLELDTEEPVVFETMYCGMRGANHGVELCRDGGRAYLKVKTLGGVNAEDYRYSINHMIKECLSDARQHLRLKYNHIPNI